MLTARLVKRIQSEIVDDFDFELDTTVTELRNAAKYLKDELGAKDDDIINILHGVATAVAEEYQG
jgi:hypothetical protein